MAGGWEDSGGRAFSLFRFHRLLLRDTLILGISSSHLAHSALLPFAPTSVSGCPLMVSQNS